MIDACVMCGGAVIREPGWTPSFCSDACREKASAPHCPLCLRTGERLIDGYCWRCTALATDVDE